MHILIGDDHLLFREGLRRLLEHLSPDARFTDASTFDEVLAFCRDRDWNDFDLILLDLNMPGWPGFSGIAEVIALVPGTPLVIVSASESSSDVREALRYGASGFIPKSSSVNVMLGALNLVFSGGVYVPPAVIQGDPGMPERGTDRLDEPRAGAARPPAANGGAGPAMLTQRQRDVLARLRAGKSNKQIAYELGLSEGTVKIHVTAIFKLLGVKDRTQAVIAAAELLDESGV